jgi:hypothetical protein
MRHDGMSGFMVGGGLFFRVHGSEKHAIPCGGIHSEVVPLACLDGTGICLFKRRQATTSISRSQYLTI